MHAIRREHPRSLVFVSGVSWAYDLRGMPLTIAAGSQEPFPNIVYAQRQRYEPTDFGLVVRRHLAGFA